MIGKVKLARCPFVNQWWEVALSLTSRGLSSGLIPAADRSFELTLDFPGDRLRILSSDGSSRSLALVPRSVADLHRGLLAMLGDLGLATEINPNPVRASPSDHGRPRQVHTAYDHDAVLRWWTAMLSVERAIQRFRTGFTGKSSPVLFSWGGFDLNDTRYNGVPVAQPASRTRSADTARTSRTSPWDSGPAAARPPIRSSTPTSHQPPDGMADVTPTSPDARFVPTSGEFVLPYELVRQAPDPEATAIAFFFSFYQQSTDLAGWDRSRLHGPAPDLRSDSFATRPDPLQEQTT